MRIFPRFKIGTASIVGAAVGALLPWFFYELFQFHHFGHADPLVAFFPLFVGSCLPLVLGYGLHFKLTEPLPLVWVSASSAFNFTFILACAYLVRWSRERELRRKAKG